jgi:AhpD family alkylhydroperoxidase
MASRFKIHDEDSAPAGARVILKAALVNGGQLPNYLGVLGGAPAALRGYVRLQAELRHNTLPAGTVERIALAAAKANRATPDITQHTRRARSSGIGIDEIMRAQRWQSEDPAQHAMLQWLKPLAERRGEVPEERQEQVRDAGWTEEQLIEAVAVLSMESMVAMIDVAGEVPDDATHEVSRQRQAA